MNLPGRIKKNIIVFVVITLFYFAYVNIFLKPSDFRSFSLVDDGQVLMQSSSYLEDCLSQFRCLKFVDQTFEFGTSRFRPSYWLINNILYETFGNNPQLHHAFRIYAVGYLTVFLLALILLDLNVGGLLIVTGVFLFTSNFSFSENIIRLGTNEPYQVLFLALFSLFYLKYRKKRLRSYSITFFLTALLVWTIFIKENNIAILPAIFLVEYFVSKNNIKKVIAFVGIPLLLFVFGVAVSRVIPSTISPDIPIYTSNYITNPLIIIKNAVSNMRLLLNSMSPILKITLLLPPLFIFIQRTRNIFKNEKIYFWLLFSGFFTLLLFPWRYVLDRYQLVSIFGLTVVSTFLIDAAIKTAREKIFFRLNPILLYTFTFQIFSFWVIMSLFIRGFSVNLAKTINYQNWFTDFTSFEAEQVKKIARYNENKVYINGVNNINNWELLYELPIHLKFIYSLEPNVELLSSPLNEGDYLFSRTSFDSVVEINDLSGVGYELVDSNSYEIDQIDPLQFRDQFVAKPLQTIMNPPLKDMGYEYYWEIRRLKDQ